MGLVVGNMKTNCDRCGHDCSYNGRDFVLVGELIELKDVWKSHAVDYLCKPCGDKANSFISYWGKKLTKDKQALSDYLFSGVVSQPKSTALYSQLSNAGYY